MKISTVTSKGFKPFEFKIKVETETDLEILWAIFNTDKVEQVKSLHPKADVFNQQFLKTSSELFLAIDHKREGIQ